MLDGTDSPLSQYEILNQELFKYSENLSKKPRCVVVNKIDIEEAKETLKEVKEELEDLEDLQVVGISAKTGINLSELLKIFRNIYDSVDK